jgi:hypothetical protein
VRLLAAWQRRLAAFFHPLVEQIPAQRAEVREQPPARDEVLAQALQLVVSEPQRVEMPNAREFARMGNFLPNRAVRIVQRLTEQADVFVGAFDAIERCRGLWHDSLPRDAGNHRTPCKGGLSEGKRGVRRADPFQTNRIRCRISSLVRAVLSFHA